MLAKLKSKYHGIIYPYLLIGLLTAVFVGAAGEFITDLMRSSQVERQRTETLEKLATIRARLEGEINSTLHLTRGLIAYVATHPEVDDHEFSQLANEIFIVGRNIRNIALAKDYVITHVHPLPGNEAALGLDYRKNKEQWPSIERAIMLNGTIVAGPVNLVQGGTALIARTPIYTRSGFSGLLHRHKPEFWGMAAVVINIPPLFRAAGISEVIDGIQFAIRDKDGMGADGEIIFGKDELFSAKPVLQDVTLPNGSWQIAALPRGGWGANLDSLWIPRLSGWMIAIVIGALLVALLWTRDTNKRLALYDHLTGLPNRRLMEDRLEQIIARNERNDTGFSLFYIDLDGFKIVNDQYGHKVGDELLLEVSRRMQAGVRSIDTVARIGGDEFVIITDGVSQSKDINRILKNIKKNLSGSVFIDNKEIEIRCSVGVATFPDDGISVDELISSGDREMYKAKNSNRIHKVDFGKQA